MPTMVPDVTAPIDALTAWLSRSETKERMQAAVSEAVADTERHVLNDLSLRVPRRKEERAGGFRPWLEAHVARFDLWLDSYKHQLAGRIQSEVLSTFPEVFATVRNRDMIREIIEVSVWPQLEPLLRRRAEDLLLTYAVRGITLSWVSRNLGDNLLLGVPEARNKRWYVPLHDPVTRQQVAEAVLNRDGEVLSDAVALRGALEVAA